MSKHTPGPWTLKVHTGNDHQIGPGDDWTIEGGGVAICFEGLRNQNADADARLIAAAPDYHEAAIAILKAHDEDAVRSNFARCGCGVCSDLRPIIAKATGE